MRRVCVLLDRACAFAASVEDRARRRDSTISQACRTTTRRSLFLFRSHVVGDIRLRSAGVMVAAARSALHSRAFLFSHVVRDFGLGSTRVMMTILLFVCRTRLRKGRERNEGHDGCSDDQLVATHFCFSSSTCRVSSNQTRRLIEQQPTPNAHRAG